jgi:hypothetical protein
VVFVLGKFNEIGRGIRGFGWCTSRSDVATGGSGCEGRKIKRERKRKGL